ncbi:ecto-ADP-ribosyltransferase 5-like protein [Labeo rohita]|uniref:NAD(P)(+)--arginine ADP-ribosyltransferase n=1 Tax=Labeo rohita TaxID=84645 RepID=A0A498MWG7_LABRO|nr:ecto-ADP-ribosyltransferase 5-like protein [Labeo rohita]
MLLIIEALLLILAALGQNYRAADEGQIFPLDMVPNSVDDQYKGCTEKMANLDHTAAVEGLKLDMALNSVDDQYKGCTGKMAKLVKTKYLKKELDNTDDFKKDHRAAAAVENTFPLDMAPNSVDDQYKGCENEMEDKVENYYLEQERSASAEFNKAWQEGEENAKKAEGSLTQNHSIAIYVYTNKDSTVYSNFTSATRTDKQKYEEGAFKWYSLHFLLTEAIQTLKKTQNRCYVTYRGTNVKFDVQSKEVRLSSFSSSSLDRKVIQGFGNVSCFEIYTCEGADLTKYSKYPEEKEDHRAAVEGQTFPLDLAPNSVDDQYKGCTEKTAELVATKYLEKERSASAEYTALGQDHRAAVEGQIFPLDMARKSVDDQYKGCKEKMANLVKTKYLNKELNNSDAFNRAWKKGVDVSKYSKLNEKEVLIPPYEKFKVTAVKKKGRKGAWCDTVYILKSTGIKSADVTKYSKLDREKEVLIPPYEKFKVTAVKKKDQEGAWCKHWDKK